MNKRLISSELRRGFTGYGFWLALLIGCAIAVWHGCCMEGAPVGFSHAGDVIYWNEEMMFPPNNVAKRRTSQRVYDGYADFGGLADGSLFKC